MATGIRPVWGDGRSDPLHLSDETPKLDAELFDPSVGDGLVAFFTRALHRKPAKRFDTADQMRQAWRALFAAAVRPSSSQEGDTTPPDTVELERLADLADDDTPVVELGLSGAALAALDRLGLGTAAQLVSFRPSDLSWATGLGLVVRREVFDAIARLRLRLDVTADDDDASVDRLVTTLLPKPQTAQSQQDRPVLHTLLGLSAFDGLGEGSVLPLAGDDAELATWPGAAEVKSARGLDRAAFDAVLQRARSRWLRQPAVTQARNDLVAILEHAGGVLSGEELALGLLGRRGSIATGGERLRRARAVVRAGLEAEALRESNRFTWRRLGGGAAVVVALANRPASDVDDALDGEELADYAANLGAVADQLAAADPLHTPGAALERLRRVAPPAGLPLLSDHRLARLAAASSATAAVSSRLELYPRALASARAVRIARAGLLGRGTVGEEEIRARVRTRFPDAAPLPPRPELDSILREEVGLEWSTEPTAPGGLPLAPGFRVPPTAAAGLTAIGGSGTRYRTGTSTSASDEARATAELTDERLRRHAAQGGYLVLTVTPDQQERAVRALTALGAVEAHGDRLVIEALHAETAAKGIDWDRAILATDAGGAGGPGWPKLMAVAKAAVARIRAQLVSGPEHIVLTHPGLLARYDLFGLVDDLRERTRLPEAGQALRTLWVLIPAADPRAAPALAGRAVPVTASTEHLALPEVWLKNLHKTLVA